MCTWQLLAPRAAAITASWVLGGNRGGGLFIHGLHAYKRTVGPRQALWVNVTRASDGRTEIDEVPVVEGSGASRCAQELFPSIHRCCSSRPMSAWKLDRP